MSGLLSLSDSKPQNLLIPETVGRKFKRQTASLQNPPQVRAAAEVSVLRTEAGPSGGRGCRSRVNEKSAGKLKGGGGSLAVGGNGSVLIKSRSGGWAGSPARFSLLRKLPLSPLQRPG